MSTRINFHYLFLIGALALSSCQKDYVITKPVVPPDTTGNATVFFATDIEPAFISNCASCHNANSASYPYMNLSAGNAYNALMSNSNGKTYVDTITPGNSLIYTKIATGGTMYDKATDVLRTNTLTWITEGAKNN